MVTFIARLKARPGKEAEAEAGLKEMAASVQAREPGALAYLCHRVADRPGEFLFYEVYADEAAKEAHMRTPHFEKLKGLIGPVLDADFGVMVEDLERIAGVIRA